MKHLIIIGVGGYAREVYWHAQGSLGYGEEWDIKGFLDGDIKLAEEEYKKLPLPLLGEVGTYHVELDDVFICAIGSSAGRKKLVENMLGSGAEFINLIHKTAIIHPTAKIGIGNIIGHFSTVHDNSVIGDFVILNGRDGIGHDAIVGDYSSIMGVVSINGYATVGKGTFWGTNSVAMAHSKIEDDAYVGVASVVFKHVGKGQRVFGNPAMPI